MLVPGRVCLIGEIEKGGVANADIVAGGKIWEMGLHSVFAGEWARGVLLCVVVCCGLSWQLDTTFPHVSAVDLLPLCLLKWK